MHKSIHHASMQSLIHPTFLPRNRLMTVMAIKLLMFCFPAQSRRLSLRRQRSLKRHRGQYLGRKPQCEGVSSFHSTVCSPGVSSLWPLVSPCTVCGTGDSSLCVLASPGAFGRRCISLPLGVARRPWSYRRFLSLASGVALHHRSLRRLISLPVGMRRRFLSDNILL